MSMAVAEDPVESRKLDRSTLAPFLVVLLVAAASVAPFLYLVVISLLPADDGGVGTLWARLFTTIPVTTYLFNSAVVSAGATVVVLMVSCMAGYGFSKLRYPGSNQLFLALIACISVPLATTIIPNYFNFAQLGGIGTYWGPIVMYAGGATPFATVLMTNFFKSLPDELVESAIVDGAAYWQVFLSILVPLTMPALMTVGVLCFLGTWNDLLVGLLFLPDPEMRTISVGIASLQGVRTTNIDMILTGSLLSAIPPIVTFVLFQKYLVAGITAGISK
jgi:multiple sugar transport system permease protein/raffinose/stachyose/melibiose transport system permease protein